MECSNCKAINMDGAKFCNKCGSAIIAEIVCINCNTINLPGSKFCKNCGNNIALTENVITAEAVVCEDNPIIKEGLSENKVLSENHQNTQETLNTDESKIMGLVKPIIEKNLAFGNSGFCFYEHIPPKKKDGALQSYAFLEKKDEEMICLYDSTVFGGAKEGVCLTDYGIYWKNIAEKGNRLMYSAIEKIQIIKKSLIINDLKIEFCDSVAELKKTLEEIVNALKGTVVFEENPEKHNPPGDNTHKKDDEDDNEGKYDPRWK